MQQQRQQDLIAQNQQLAKLVQAKEQEGRGKVEQLMQALMLCQLEVLKVTARSNACATCSATGTQNVASTPRR